MGDKQVIDESKMSFWLDQLRTVNFFTIKSAMGETKSIKNPIDLYRLPTDNIEPQEIKPMILTDSDMLMIERMLSKQLN